MRRIVSVLVVGMLVMGAVSVSGQGTSPDEFGSEEHPHAARIRVDNAVVLESLRAAGLDVTHDVTSVEDGVEATVILTDAEEELVGDIGGEVLSTTEIPTLEELQADLTPRHDSPTHVDGVDPEAITRAKTRVRPDPSGGGRDGRPPPTVPDTTLNLLRADSFQNFAGFFVSFEVHPALGESDEVTVSWDEQNITLDVFTDVGQYLYHRTTNPVSADELPDEVTMTSSDGTSITVPVTEWIPGEEEGFPPGYQWGFTDTGYLDPDQINTIIEDLATQYPDLTEVIELPFQSVGYQWPAQALVFDGDIGAGLYAETNIMGHEGGNDYVLEISDPGVPDSDLAATLDGTTVNVLLATDGAGTLVSTAAEVAAAISSLDGVNAYTLRDDPGEGVVQPTTVQFDDGLDAPESYPRGPMTIKVLRIGADPSGDKPGIYLYSQEHAREWVTPLVAVETANRLLTNYGSDPTTAALVDGLDIFIQPFVNPDGAAYSLYDDQFQRTNLSRHCDPGVVDPFLVTNSGVDLNRNFTVGSRLDGYSGAPVETVSARSSPAQRRRASPNRATRCG
ncbi:MAG: hypothetical protein GEU79_12550 [Acidimicrobiia bacterium]|nr:hypothetical protein [Acidimicrobiia bacterium]